MILDTFNETCYLISFLYIKRPFSVYKVLTKSSKLENTTSLPLHLSVFFIRVMIIWMSFSYKQICGHED